VYVISLYLHEALQLYFQSFEYLMIPLLVNLAMHHKINYLLILLCNHTCNQSYFNFVKPWIEIICWYWMNICFLFSFTTLLVLLCNHTCNKLYFNVVKPWIETICWYCMNICFLFSFTTLLDFYQFSLFYLIPWCMSQYTNWY